MQPCHFTTTQNTAIGLGICATGVYVAAVVLKAWNVDEG